MTLILGIETSCDETAAAVVEDGRRILSNRVASQIPIHAAFGGVFPEIASREHVLKIVPVIDDALKQAGLGFRDLAAVAVTHGPGLAGSLLVGVNTAKSRCLYERSAAHRHQSSRRTHLCQLAGGDDADSATHGFPLVALIVSGGHSEIVLMRQHNDYQLLVTLWMTPPARRLIRSRAYWVWATPVDRRFRRQLKPAIPTLPAAARLAARQL